MRSPLPIKKLIHNDWVIENHPEYIERWERIIFFDPTEVYARIDHLIKPNARIQSISIGCFFPDIEGVCCCGCEKKLEGRKERYATEECKNFVYGVHNIICNIHQAPIKYFTKYSGNDCMECKECPGEELDHIIGVKHGGGGCWLSNYRWLCKKCHRAKTNKDFGHKPGVQKNKKQEQELPF